MPQLASTACFLLPSGLHSALISVGPSCHHVTGGGGGCALFAIMSLGACSQRHHVTGSVLSTPLICHLFSDSLRVRRLVSKMSAPVHKAQVFGE